ncbi:hypothetical protein BFR57_03365 [Idiomarina sp. MD25a]|uniref:glycosyltransferase family 4 protein n=1 Tax=Idiomarina sp. MD25a TaxID=1889913 RepID=UPI0008F82799|nr:glycosyltransferase family 4 protein [Idiomarina sp. MD25a]OIM99617.1 hypothetical protein BFR57_03365 [Idiomarina sp. MD25a]
MKVLFVSYPHVGIGKGGLLKQIQKTKESLERLGVAVDYHSFAQESLSGYDVLHFFGLDSLNPVLIQQAREAGIKLVVSPVFNRFGLSKFRYKVEQLMMRRVPSIKPQLAKINIQMVKFDSVICLNTMEKNLIQSYFRVPKERLRVIGNGFDDLLNNVDNNSSIKVEKKKQVLCVGEICERKNQLKLIRAMKGINAELFLVGPHKNSSYVKKSLDMASQLANVHIVGERPFNSIDLIRLYQESKVFCLPSISEVEPLTVLEAAAFGCNLVCSRTYPINSKVKERVHLVRPDNLRSIRMAIIKSLNAPTPNAPVNLETWDDIAKSILNLYRV